MSELNFLIDHVFLPPKLPAEDDSDYDHEMALVAAVRAALKAFRNWDDNARSQLWSSLAAMVDNVTSRHDGSGHLATAKVHAALRDMVAGEIELLAFQIKGQNAGLIIRNTTNGYAFEAFELSPLPEAVMATQGRLRRIFPGTSVILDPARMEDPKFRHMLASTLAKLDAETPTCVIPTSKKAGCDLQESRSTVDPRLVTDMLMTMLHAIGRAAQPQRVWKNMRDDVIGGGLRPWRRASIWTLLRVTLQTTLIYQSKSVAEGCRLYKSFMMFFLAQSARQALSASLPSELLRIMINKITRRGLKLDDEDVSGREYVQGVVSDVHRELERRWSLLQDEPLEGSITSLLTPPDMSRELDLELPTLGPYLEGILRRELQDRASKHAVPTSKPRCHGTPSCLPSVNVLAGLSGHAARMCLADIERWVQHRLQPWLAANCTDDRSLEALASLLPSYSVKAKTVYNNEPQNVSLMVLTAVDLWIALDTCVLHHVPLLLDFDPCIPDGILACLLLPSLGYMRSLVRIEAYLAKRKAGARPGMLQPFFSEGKPESLAVVFYHQSSQHQALRSRIENDARGLLEQKRQELASKKEKYQDLIQQAAELECEYVQRYKRRKSYLAHSNNCQKCRLTSQAQALTIEVYEWPLPRGDLQAKAAVFELQVPKSIALWREATYNLLVDTLAVNVEQKRSNGGSQNKTYDLAHFRGLTNYARASPSVLRFTSDKKPVNQSHWRVMKVLEAKAEDVCANHGADYAMFDTASSRWITGISSVNRLRAKCTFNLPDGIYNCLRDTLADTAHNDNEIIARQNECPTELSATDFYNFGSLRAGHRLQWLKIARGIRAFELDLNRIEVFLLITQATWQAGPADSSEPLRQSHVDLADQHFASCLLDSLKAALAATERNWQGAQTCRVIAMLTIRLLSFSPFQLIHGDCVSLLIAVRKVTFGWMRELQHTDEASMLSEDEKTRILRIALTCQATFHVDESQAAGILAKIDDVATLIECCLVIHDHRPTDAFGVSSGTDGHMLQLFDRSLHLLEPFLSARILQSPEGLDRALNHIWSGYSPTQGWSDLHGNQGSWLQTQMSGDDGQATASVAYNLLDGNLLVNGLPLSRLPKEIEQHASFQRLFAKKAVHVLPTTEMGMTFEARALIHGHRLFFMLQGSEVIIRVFKGSQRYEILPLSALGRDLPVALRQGFTHWFNLDTHCVEWRRLDTMWMASPGYPILQTTPGTQTRRLSLDSALTLLEPSSQTAQRICYILRPIEQAQHIWISADVHAEMITVHLPRYKLDFSIGKGSSVLESKQFRGSVIDATQHFGAFSGLETKLVLKNAVTSARSVLVPYGKLQAKKAGDHVALTVLSFEDDASYHVFQIDTNLGQLADNGRLLARLHMAYLYAMSSHCLPDSLTGMIGTESALAILRSASVRSFLKLTNDERDLLKSISELTPKREYYPSHLQVMQIVSWNVMPQLAQHEAFCEEASSIMQQAQELGIFSGSPNVAPLRNHRGSKDLQVRASIRGSANRLDGFGGEVFTKSMDSVYKSRDTSNHSSRQRAVYSISRLVDDWSGPGLILPNVFESIKAWDTPIAGSSATDCFWLGFDFSWLEPSSAQLAESWSKLVRKLSTSSRNDDKYDLMMFLTSINHGGKVSEQLVHTMLAFATVPVLRQHALITSETCTLSHGDDPVHSVLLQALEEHVKPLESCPEHNIPRLDEETDSAYFERQNGLYNDNCDRALNEQISLWVDQWPSRAFRGPFAPHFRVYANHSMALAVASKWAREWHNNRTFREVASRTQVILNEISLTPLEFTHLPVAADASYSRPHMALIPLASLQEKAVPHLQALSSRDLTKYQEALEASNDARSSLKPLLGELLRNAPDEHTRNYARDLLESFDSPHPQSNARRLRGTKTTLTHLLFRLEREFQSCVESIWANICARLRVTFSSWQRLAFETDHGPRLTKLILLQRLGLPESLKSPLDRKWEHTILSLGVSIARTQHLTRLLLSVENESDFLAELSTSQERNWDVRQHPEWLLFEISANLTIRPNQSCIAQEMILPASNRNSLLQLNMGEGKSSVIVPIVAASLADTKSLVRVVVLSPLASQMFQLLRSKLGGLLNRRIYSLPLSRSIKLDKAHVRQIQELYQECMSSGGVLLIQPEHLCSFELMCIEKANSKDDGLAVALRQTQSWLDRFSRDILDESDEILSVRFELVYTMGTQQDIDHSPSRWSIIQDLLRLVSQAVVELHHEHPDDFEIENVEAGSFPRIRILRKEAGAVLIRRIVHDLCAHGISHVDFWQLDEELRAAIADFLTGNRPDFQLVSDDSAANDLLSQALLLLRGVVTDGVLSFALGQKRWRVDYGLDLSRTLLAVPYRSKDMPSPRAEFSHPDATIILTCLSFYYGGLTKGHFETALDKLRQCDHADEEYKMWVHGVPNVPVAFQSISGVNLSDSNCIAQLFELLRRSKGAIDFFLCRVAFPAQMKEFPYKISTSAWDLARAKTGLTTGFSGTNDSRHVLPLSIMQRSLPQERHTNATQLACLLQPENQYALGRCNAATGALTAESLLETILEADPPIKVLLDVGAQVLEWRNGKVAREWLHRVPTDSAQAAVYFDDADELSVIDRTGAVERLSDSPFLRQMDQCLIYLDEAHTRGTDLKLPLDYRAGVTLGPRLSKDRLVQACMRMRKLGQGQSVLLIGSPEIERKINACRPSIGDDIAILDVLRWVIYETIQDTRRNVPRWAMQGMRHQRQYEPRRRLLATSDTNEAQSMAHQLLEPEAQTLAERYGAGNCSRDEKCLLRGLEDTELRNRVVQVREIRQKCRDFNLKSFQTAAFQEEAERELSPEHERERQIERPRPQKPHRPYLHPDVARIVSEGRIPLASLGLQTGDNPPPLQSAFDVFKTTTTARTFEQNAWARVLQATTDFTTTIQTHASSKLDSFLRPVNWLLSVQDGNQRRFVVISPFEANEMLPEIRKTGLAKLHVYAPRTGRQLPSFEDLDFCAVPSGEFQLPSPLAMMHLGLFSGSLYLRTFEDYRAICRVLGLLYEPPRAGVRARPDGFLVPAQRARYDTAMAQMCVLSRSPVAFLERLITMRRKGQGFERSHLGRILGGQRLGQKDFDGAQLEM